MFLTRYKFIVITFGIVKDPEKDNTFYPEILFTLKGMP